MAVLVRSFPLVLAMLVGVCVAGDSRAQQPPGFPALFFGPVAVDGQPPEPGTRVRAFIGGVDCTQANSGRTVVDGGIGGYSVTVVHENQVAGCGAEGKSVTFRIGDQEAGQTGTWSPGPQELALYVGSATPPPLPTRMAPTSSPAANPTEAPATQTYVAQFTPAPAPSVLPTDEPGVIGGGESATSTAENGTGTPGQTGSPTPDGEGGTSSGVDRTLGPWTWAVIAVLIVGGVATGFLLSRRKHGVSTD
jgi:hypothetical protein